MAHDITPVENEVAAEIVALMVVRAEEAAGGPLPTLHTRAPVPRLELAIQQAVTEPSRELLGVLAGPDAFIQGMPNIRIHSPLDPASVVPFHSDVLYGHSPEEVNYWVSLTPAYGTNSLWMADPYQTENIHDSLKQRQLNLEEFEELARGTARPIEAAGPGIFTFCCAQVHGSVLNETDHTRVSIDIRVLGAGRRANVKKVGGYFRPQWLGRRDCPLPAGQPVTTVASLDEATPVYLQRVAMERFYPQGGHRELVEFHGLPYHSPTLVDAMARGPVIAYTVKQLRRAPELLHPVGFVDQRVWFVPGQEEELARLMREVGPHEIAA
jgi:hypothetical protein